MDHNHDTTMTLPDCEHRVGGRCTKYNISVKWCETCLSERVGPGYRKLWDEGRGPGQNLPTTPQDHGDRLSPQERIEKTFREYVTDRPLARGMTFSQALLSLSCRPWAEIQKTLALCLECEHFQNNRCMVYGESCQARTQWIRYILRRPCREKES